MPFKPVHIQKRVGGNGQIGLLGAQQLFMVSALTRVKGNILDAELILRECHQRRG